MKEISVLRSNLPDPKAREEFLKASTRLSRPHSSRSDFFIKHAARCAFQPGRSWDIYFFEQGLM